MSEHNVETARRGLEAFNGGAEAFIAFIGPDFEARTQPELSVEPDVYRGPDGIRRYFTSFEEAMEEIRFDAEEFIDAGDYVVVPARLSAKGKGTGISVVQPSTLVWTFRDGRPVALTSYATTEVALAAAGLSPSRRPA
jgi:ketosteroid isomerase-like protein